MAFLYSHSDTVEQLTGLCLKATQLTTTQYHDRRHVLPMVLRKDGKDHFLVRQIETGNVSGAGFDRMPVVLFGPYWLPKQDADAYETPAHAAADLSKGETIAVDDAMPVSVFQTLKGLSKVEVMRKAPAPVDVFRVSVRDVLASFNHNRPQVVDIVTRLTREHPHYDRLARWYGSRSNTSFELLDQMAGDQGLGALLGSWVTDFQELSGMPGTLAEIRGYAALYLVGEGETWIIVPQGENSGGMKPARTYPSFSAAVRDIAGDRVVGYEADTLDSSRFLDMEDAGVALADGGQVMRDWRDEKAFYDIPYFVLAALASRHAIDGASAFADRAIGAGVEISEKDVDRVYHHLLEEFVVENRLPVVLKHYFTNNHAGSRTIFPSRPGSYRLSRGIDSLKIDAGVFVFDDGLFHACSDIARTVTTSPAATEVRDVMERVMLEDTIPAIRSGMTGEEIHRMGVNQMGAHEEVFHKFGYMPETFSWRASYVRDIGHTLERQETNTFGFKPGVKRPVRAGMPGCIEYHCAYNGHAIAVEDTFVVDDEGAIVISRGPEEFGDDGKVSRRRFS